jgi:hypothetical protein
MKKVLPILFVLLAACSGAGPREAAHSDETDGLAAGLREPDVIFVPTPMPVVEQMLRFADVDKDDVVYDLGSGDGRIVITAAREYGARGVGIDIDPERIVESRENAGTAKVTDRVEFRNADLFETDLRPASAVTLYLLQPLNVKLRPKLFAELRPGTPVVSHDFDMGDWATDSTVVVEGKTVHLWYVPENVSGTYRVNRGSGTGSGQLDLAQRYQRGSGSLTLNGRTMKVENLRVRGSRVTFAISDNGGVQTFEGEFKDNKLTGNVTGGALQGALTASRTSGPRHISGSTP